jgi:hypothetical protein
MNLLVLLLIVTLVKSLGQVVDTIKQEWESRVGKINSNTSKDTNEFQLLALTLT